MKNIILTFIAICSIALCYGQGIEYKGTLLLPKVFLPVKGIEVKIKGEVKLTTTTDKDGAFYVPNVKYPFRVTFQHKEYVKSSYTVNSEEDRAFFISKKADIEKTLLDRLRASGVRIVGDKVVIEGTAPPLILVDGQAYVGSILDIGIEPSEIKSVRVLRGAETGSYGMAGMGGVIVITTKPKE